MDLLYKKIRTEEDEVVRHFVCPLSEPNFSNEVMNGSCSRFTKLEVP